MTTLKLIRSVITTSFWPMLTKIYTTWKPSLGKTPISCSTLHSQLSLGKYSRSSQDLQSLLSVGDTGRFTGTYKGNKGTGELIEVVGYGTAEVNDKL